MTPKEALNTKIGARVVWESSNERGTVVDKSAAGILVRWDDGTEIVYEYAETRHGLRHVQLEK
jgi:hypothetical protein